MDKNETIYYNIGRVLPDPNWSIRKQRHPYCELIIAHAGKMFIEDAEGGKYVLHSGECALYPAGVEHSEHSSSEEPVATTYISFATEFMQKNIRIYSDRGGVVATLAGLLYERRFGHATDWHHNCLRLILSELRFLAQQVSTEDDWIQEINLYMQRNLEHKLNLSTLAKTAKMSKYHFIRRYREATNETPIAHLNKLRCSEAKKLLFYSTLPIKEVAYRTGFADSFCLSKSLKKHYGKSSSEIRKSLK